MTHARLIASLRSDLDTAGFTAAAVDSLWGPDAAAALRRNQRVPAFRALDRLARTEGESARATLSRLFILGVAVDDTAFAQALPELGLAGAVELGLVVEEEPGIRPLVQIQPYSFVDGHGAGHWWIVSDLGEKSLGGALREDHVLGIGGASSTLSGLMVSAPVQSALDLGTGCGVQALHASRHAARVVATDISERALEFARINARLNGIDSIEFRLGSLFEPVRGERFDLIVSNPPFVITPRTPDVPSYEYRDGGMVGDALVETVVREAGAHLTPGGIAQFLGNWEYHGPNDDALDRVLEWAASGDRSPGVWALEREVQDAALYAETWIRDGGTRPGPKFDALYSAWLADFDSRNVTAVGFGYLTLRSPLTVEAAEVEAATPVAGEAAAPVPGGVPAPFTPRMGSLAPEQSRAQPAQAAPLRRGERVTGPLGHNPAGLGEHIEATLAAHDWQAARADGWMLRERLAVASDVTEDRHYWPGEEHPTVMTLRQGGGFGRSVPLSTELAAFVGASDGELTVGSIIGAIAQLLDADNSALAASLLPVIRELVVTGFLQPAA